MGSLRQWRGYYLEFLWGKLSLLLFCCCFLGSCFEFLQSLWNSFPVVTYIIRSITVSDESCKLFHQQTGPAIFHLALFFLTVICAANPKYFRKTGKEKTLISCKYWQDSILVFCRFIFFSCLIIVPVCVFAKQLSIAEGAGGSVFWQQINISTRIRGASAHHSGWKLLQSFLWRKEMVPNQSGENGITQNNGVIEDCWGGRGWRGGESLPVLLWVGASLWCPLAWRTHNRGPPPKAWMWPHSATGLQTRRPPHTHPCPHNTFRHVFQLRSWPYNFCCLLKGRSDAYFFLSFLQMGRIVNRLKCWHKDIFILQLSKDACFLWLLQFLL